MDRAYWLAVDAGGSKTVARLATVLPGDGVGRTLGEGRGGPANCATNPLSAWQSIETAVEAAYRQADVTLESVKITHACLGVAGVDAIDPCWPTTWPAPPFASVLIENDAVIAHAGAFGLGDGGLMIVGTGSVGLSVVEGRRSLVGGQGAQISDEGSGAWIGREALRHAVWMIDGRAAPSRLASEISDILGDLRHASDWASCASPGDYAALAPVVVRLAEEGDRPAEHILRDAASHLARIAAALGRTGVTDLGLVGGLSHVMAPRLEQAGVRLTSPAGDALAGAMMLIGGARS